MKPLPAAKPDQPPAILLVDDNQHGLVARKTLLEEMGYAVTTASSGEEAVERFAPGSYDLVVTDYKMPHMNGVELIRKIRSQEPAARIILLSGFVEPLGLSEQSTGADVVIAKSASEVSNLLRWVNRLLSRRVARKPPGSQASPSKARAKTV